MTDQSSSTQGATQTQSQIPASSPTPSPSSDVQTGTSTSPSTTQQNSQVQKEESSFLSNLTSSLAKVGHTVTHPFGRGTSTPENLAEKLEILDASGGIDPGKVTGVEKMKFGTDIDAIVLTHKESGKKYCVLPNPRRMLPLKGARKIVGHVTIFHTDYLEYENDYMIPINQRCMCDVKGNIFIDNYKYIDTTELIVNGEACIKVAYDYGDTVREVFTLVNKTGHRIGGLNFTVEKIRGTSDILMIQDKSSKKKYYYLLDKSKLQDYSSKIDQNHYNQQTNNMLVFEIFDRQYVLGVDGEWLPISDPALLGDMCIDSQKNQLLKSIS